MRVANGNSSPGMWSFQCDTFLCNNIKISIGLTHVHWECSQSDRIIQKWDAFSKHKANKLRTRGRLNWWRTQNLYILWTFWQHKAGLYWTIWRHNQSQKASIYFLYSKGMIGSIDVNWSPIMRNSLELFEIFSVSSSRRKVYSQSLCVLKRLQLTRRKSFV